MPYVDWVDYGDSQPPKSAPPATARQL